MVRRRRRSPAAQRRPRRPYDAAAARGRAPERRADPTSRSRPTVRRAARRRAAGRAARAARSHTSAIKSSDGCPHSHMSLMIPIPSAPTVTTASGFHRRRTTTVATPSSAVAPIMFIATASPRSDPPSVRPRRQTTNSNGPAWSHGSEYVCWQRLESMAAPACAKLWASENVPLFKIRPRHARSGEHDQSDGGERRVLAPGGRPTRPGHRSRGTSALPRLR
jgi:hypothetical protein